MTDFSTTFSARPRQEALRRRYERYPYPGYPLWSGLRWQEGYLASPGFAAEVAGTQPWRDRAGGRVLVLGCGDTFAEGFNAWLKEGDQADYVDFAAAPLRRSQLRTVFSPARHRYHHAAIEDFVRESEGCRYHHIEAFGVLHHCPDPGMILNHCARLLVPGGTMRLMVYNSPARARIHAIQDLAADQGWLMAERPPLAELRRWLAALAAEVPGFESYGQLTGSREAELVDALLNPLEQRLAPSAWRGMIAAAGLTVAGQFDRYGQLDHLENPLAAPPTAAALDQLADVGLLTQNLEFYLSRPGSLGRSALGRSASLAWADAARWGLRRWQSPARLSAGDQSLRGQPWRAFLDYLWFGLRPDRSRYEGLSAATLGRLTRQGLVLPAMLKGAKPPLASSCHQPLSPAPAEPDHRGYCADSLTQWHAKQLAS